MFGVRLAWIPARGLGGILPHGSLAVFCRGRVVVRGDVVLVDHPDHGRLVRRVYAVSRKGKVSFEPLSGMHKPIRNLGLVPPERVLGKLVMRLI